MNDAAAAPGRIALVFLDEMGYARWPEPACDWTGRAPASPPLADRAESPRPPLADHRRDERPDGPGGLSWTRTSWGGPRSSNFMNN